MPGEKVQNYLWAHTVVCPNCESIVPLSPNWWLSKTSNYAGKGQERKITSDWYAIKPLSNPRNKRVDFELVKGRKGKGTSIHASDGEYDPDTATTIARGVGKCVNCGNVIEDEIIKAQAKSKALNHQLYAVAYRRGLSNIEFKLPTNEDIQGYSYTLEYLNKTLSDLQLNDLIPLEAIINDHGHILNYCQVWSDLFNPRQLLTLITYINIINDAKRVIGSEYEADKAEAITVYLSLILDRCVDRNCRLCVWHSSRVCVERASTQHALNSMWNYPEINGAGELWRSSADAFASDYSKLCNFIGSKPGSKYISGIEEYDPKFIQINLASADSLFHIADKSIPLVVTDPPYYGAVPYADLIDFFYVWMKRILNDVSPELFSTEICDREREAVANPSRFRNMGASPEELANQDYEAKMALAFAEYYRVLRDDGVMTVQFNHKDSGAWDVLAKSLIDAGFEITASWAVSTENPQNLHQAQKNSVSSTVLLVCRKRDPNAGQAWWDDLRPDVANLVEQRAPNLRQTTSQASTST